MPKRKRESETVNPRDPASCLPPVCRRCGGKLLQAIPDSSWPHLVAKGEYECGSWWLAFDDSRQGPCIIKECRAEVRQRLHEEARSEEKEKAKEIARPPSEQAAGS